MKKKIDFTLNGKSVSATVDEDRTLLWVLRGELGLTGTKFGCGRSYCGACTVVVNGEALRSCQLKMEDIMGSEVLTIEGLATSNGLHPLQRAFIEHDALQCGYCTPGMIMNAYALIEKNSNPTREEIISEMEGNLCRCGAHVRIFDAIESLAK